MRIIGRAEWGARYPDGNGDRRLPATEAWLHHSATGTLSPTATFEQDCAAVRNLEAIGQSRYQRGISYTFVGTPAGRLFQGHSVHRIGTHTGGRNSIAIALCWIGNYENDTPSSAQIAVAAELLNHLKAAGYLTSNQFRGGHRDVLRLTGDSISTACPGANAYARIPDINRLALHPGTLEDDVVTPEDRKLIAAEVWGYVIAKRGNLGPASAETWLTAALARASDAADLSASTDQAVQPMPAALASIGATADDVQAKLGAQADTIAAAITSAIDAATGGNVDEAIVRNAVHDAVSRLQITLPDNGEDVV